MKKIRRRKNRDERKNFPVADDTYDVLLQIKNDRNLRDGDSVIQWMLYEIDRLYRIVTPVAGSEPAKVEPIEEEPVVLKPVEEPIEKPVMLEPVTEKEPAKVEPILEEEPVMLNPVEDIERVHNNVDELLKNKRR